MKPGDPGRASPPRERGLWHRHRVELLVFLLGLLLHGHSAPRHGLYWDDVKHFLEPMALKGKTLDFVVADTTAAFRSERPATYLTFVVARLAFLLGLPALHLLTAALFALNAAALARAVRVALGAEAIGLLAGGLFLVYPLAPLQPIWPSTMHYTSGQALALAAAALAVSRPARGRGLVLPALLQALAQWTFEAAAGIAPAFVAAALLLGRLGLTSLDPAATRRARQSLVLFGTLVVGMYLPWRLWLLPHYGVATYGHDRLAPLEDWPQRIAASLPVLFFPWRRALDESAASLELVPVLLIAVLAGAASFRLLGARWERDLRAGVGAIGIALALLLATVVPLAIAPGGSFSDVVGFASRLNHPALPGICLLLAGASFVLAGGRGRRGLAVRVAASAGLGLAAAAGASLHRATERVAAEDWALIRRDLLDLSAAAPALAPETFVVLDTAWHERLGRTGRYGMSHEEIGGYLIARYQDWSLQGSLRSELHKTRRGVRPTNWGAAATWFPPGSRGLVRNDANQVVASVAEDRLVCFQDDGRRLRPVAQLELKNAMGRIVPLRHNPDRILARPAPPSRAWCHVFAEDCRRYR